MRRVDLIAEMARLLRQVEWRQYGGPVYECPACTPGSWTFSMKHRDDCRLAAALVEADAIIKQSAALTPAQKPQEETE